MFSSANRRVRSPSSDSQSPWPRYGSHRSARNSKLSITSSNPDDTTLEYHRKMASKDKKHRAMGDEEWMSRLRRFAAVGVWPSDAGNRPAPRQKKWHDLYLKIEKCPMQRRGQMSLFGGTQTCSCGFHTKKLGTCLSLSDTTTKTLNATSVRILLFNTWSDSA
ncbi:uncharacterized protein LOC124850933 isoform X2 [Scophthalmus maximus]|uniref:uncharacterized protein LOC124850933 isoform X2 n=1 Tax=Scophthalmus maximus TaxID=52904 RepID=UPI0015E158B0|nr:uncharacterized protein LOC124850933 isoform X2 [Scophthalmus maximus]